jgi:hypothetical protein
MNFWVRGWVEVAGQYSHLGVGAYVEVLRTSLSDVLRMTVCLASVKKRRLSVGDEEAIH